MPAITIGSKQAINESGKIVGFVGMAPANDATAFLQNFLVSVDANAISHRHWSRQTGNREMDWLVPLAMWYLLEIRIWPCAPRIFSSCGTKVSQLTDGEAKWWRL